MSSNILRAYHTRNAPEEHPTRIRSTAITATATMLSARYHWHLFHVGWPQTMTMRVEDWNTLLAYGMFHAAGDKLRTPGTAIAEDEFTSIPTIDTPVFPIKFL